MKDTYTIRLVKTENPLLGFLNKTFKNVKGNLFPQDLNPNGNVKFMLVILEDETKIVVNLEKYSRYTLSKELFYITAKEAEKNSQGQYKAPTPEK